MKVMDLGSKMVVGMSLVSSATSSSVLTSAKFKMFVATVLVAAAGTAFSSSAMAVGPYSPPTSVQAQNAVEKQLARTDLKTVTRSIADASACGIQGSATVVDVQLPLAQKVTARDGTVSTVKEFVKVKSYVVSAGYFGVTIDSETCLK